MPGFTLIELMVVLIALVIVAAAVVPALRGAGHQGDLDSAASRVAAAARVGRDTAVEQQVPIDLTLENEPAPRLRLVPAADGATVPQPVGSTTAAPPLLPAVFASVPMPPRVTAHLEAVPVDPGSNSSPLVSAPRTGNPGETSLRFPPDGRTAGGVVVLSDDRGHERRVLVTPETGVVRIEEGGEVSDRLRMADGGLRISDKVKGSRLVVGVFCRIIRKPHIRRSAIVPHSPWSRCWLRRRCWRSGSAPRCGRWAP